MLTRAAIRGAATRVRCCMWSATALALLSCKPPPSVRNAPDELPPPSAAVAARSPGGETPSSSSLATVSPEAIPVRRLSTALPFEVAVVSEGHLLLASPDGHAEIRDVAGTIASVLTIPLLPLTKAQSVPGGWVVIGSLPTRNDAEETGAAMRVGLDGKIGPTWRAPGLFASIAATESSVFASDVLGPVYSLLSDGSLAPVQVPPTVQGGAVQIMLWGDKTVFCKSGELRKEGDPYGVCVANDGTSVRDIWRVPPVDCGGFLIADVREDARATSAWSRAIWSDMRLANPIKHPIGGKPEGIGCIGGLLVDLKFPGRLQSLPALDELRKPLCDPASMAVVTGRDDVWCIGRK
jgi:hypothetical protein